MEHPDPPDPRLAHSERLTVPWLWWPVALGLAALLAAQVGLGAPGAVTWLPYVVLLPGTAVGLWWAGRIKVRVVGDELHVDDARLPVGVIADVIPLDAEGRRHLLGPGSDPLAFVIQRPWVRGCVQILLDDPADPTPYWLVSTRHPERLTAALLRAGARQAPAAERGGALADR